MGSKVCFKQCKIFLKFGHFRWNGPLVVQWKYGLTADRLTKNNHTNVITMTSKTMTTIAVKETDNTSLLQSCSCRFTKRLNFRHNNFHRILYWLNGQVRLWRHEWCIHMIIFAYYRINYALKGRFFFITKYMYIVSVWYNFYCI